MSSRVTSLDGIQGARELEGFMRMQISRIVDDLRLGRGVVQPRAHAIGPKRETLDEIDRTGVGAGR